MKTATRGNGSTTTQVGQYLLRFPEPALDRDQDAEWFEVKIDGAWTRFRLHDYGPVFDIPGLYEAVVYDTLKCRSPQRVVDLLDAVLEDWTESMPDLRILDLGAGNGIVAQRLRTRDVSKIVGVDLIPEARTAALRDRPNAYDDYLVGDLTRLPADRADQLRRYDLNCLVTVAALGFGDVPAPAFATAFNLLREKGWIAINIKENFLHPTTDDSGFARLIRLMVRERIIAIEAHHRYCHRLSMAGHQLFYVAMVARKLQHVPETLLHQAVEGADAPVPELVRNHLAAVFGT